MWQTFQLGFCLVNRRKFVLVPQGLYIIKVFRIKSSGLKLCYIFLNIIAFIFFPFRISSDKRCITVNSVKNSTSMYTSYYIKKIPFFSHHSYTLYLGKYSPPPPFFRPFHHGCPKANSNASNYLSLNQTLFWANSRRAKPFAGKEIKINRGENNPVYITVILVSNVSASHCQHVSCNGGHCLSKDQSYICICPVGYDGRNCQHKGELFDS